MAAATMATTVVEVRPSHSRATMADWRFAGILKRQSGRSASTWPACHRRKSKRRLLLLGGQGNARLPGFEDPTELLGQDIVGQLAASAWLTQGRDDVSYTASIGVAVREYPLASGPCNSLLPVDGRACSVIEVTSAGTTLSGVAEQASGYQTDLPAALVCRVNPTRFYFEATGDGILFGGGQDPPRLPPRLRLHRSETLLTWLRTELFPTTFARSLR